MNEASVEQGFQVADSDTDRKATTSGKKPTDEKADRLAEALRANLKRRKSQARERTHKEATSDPTSDSNMA